MYLILIAIIFSLTSHGFVYEGTLLDADGNPLAEPNVDLRIDLLEESGTCVLYTRLINVDLSSSQGQFSVDLAVAGTPPTGEPHENTTLDQALSNVTDHSLVCSDSSPDNFTGTFSRRRVRITITSINSIDISDITLPAQFVGPTAYAGESQLARTVPDGSVTNAKVASGIDAAKLTGSLPAIDGSALVGVTATGGIGADTIGDTQLADDSVDTAAIQDSAVTNDKIAGMTVDKLISAASAFFSYAPGNTQCNDGEVLKWTAGDRWECAVDENSNTLASMSGTSDNIAQGSTNLFMTTAERDKLTNIAVGANVNVQADWNAGSGDAQILNKPSIPSDISDLTLGNDSISGDSVDGGVISNFESTGIDDNSSSTRIYIHSSGRVGINEASPDYELDINGDLQLQNDAALYFDGPHGSLKETAGVMEIESWNGIVMDSGKFGPSSFIVQNDGANIFTVQDSGHSGFGGDLYPDATLELVGDFMISSHVEGDGNRLIVNSTGSVGIGTLSPSRKLYVAGGDVGLDTTQSYRVGGVSVASSVGGNTSLGSVNSTFIQSGNSSQAYFAPTSGLTLGSNYSGSWVTPPANGLLVEGNVGVGTTSPESRVDIIGSTQGDIAVHGSEVPALVLQQRSGGPANEYGAMLEFRVDNGLDTWSSGAIVGKPYPSWGGGLSLFTQTTGANNPPGRRTVGNNLVERLTIHPSGNIGIGTTTPSTKLDVVGSVRLEELELKRVSDGATIPSVITTDSGNSVLFGNSSNSSGLKFYSSLGNEAIRVDNGGVHLSNQQRIVHSGADVSTGQDGFLNLYETLGGGHLILGITDGEDRGYIQGWLSSPGTADDIYLNPFGGQIGIGTTSPGYPLEVNGVIHSSAGGIRLPDGTVIDDASDLGGNSVYGNHSSAASDSLYVDNAGNVGVGTLSPEVALDVDGEIRADYNHCFDTDDTVRYTTNTSYTTLSGLDCNLTVKDGDIIKVYISSSMYLDAGADNNSGAWMQAIMDGGSVTTVMGSEVRAGYAGNNNSSTHGGYALFRATSDGTLTARLQVKKYGNGTARFTRLRLIAEVMGR